MSSSPLGCDFEPRYYRGHEITTQQMTADDGRILQ